MKTLSATIIVVALLGLVACGGSGGGGSSTPSTDSNTTASTTISGTVATGAPVVGAVVTAACKANQSFTSQPTDTTGSYTTALTNTALPCILSTTLESGEEMRSFAVAASTVNVTPLTELIVRRAGADPALAGRATQETLQLLNTMQVPFKGDPTTTAFVPDGSGNDAALLKLFPRMASTLANGQSTMAFGANLAAYERIDPATYPAVMPPVDDPLWDAIQLGSAKAVNEVFFGVGGYFSDKLDSPTQLLVEKLLNYGMGVMFKELAKKAFVKCASPECAQKIVQAFAKSLKSDATTSPSNYLKNIIKNPAELIVSSVFDAIADYYEQSLTDYLISDGTLSARDNFELTIAVYGGRVAAHTAINQFIGGKPLPLATLEAEFSVGFSYAKQDIVNLYYIAKMQYDTAKENRLTENMFQVYLVRKNFKTDAATTFASWYATDHSLDVMATLNAKALAAKSEVQRLAQLLPTQQQLAQVALANSLFDQIIASYLSKVQAIKLAKVPLTVTPITAPTGLAATAGNGQATISWNAVSGATYNVYLASATGVTKSNYSSLAGGKKVAGITSPSASISLTNGTTYYFVVTAVDANGESVESSQVSATPQAVTVTPIAAPTSPSATAGNGQATISWTAVSGATSYNLYMAAATGVTKSNYNSLTGGTTAIGVTSPFVKTGLTNGTPYYFVVTAVNANGESVESSQISFMPQAASALVTQFTDNFDGTSLQSAYWTVAGISGATTVAGGEVALACGGGATTKGKMTFSGSQVVVEARFSGIGHSPWGRDTAFQVIDANSGEVIQVGDTTYRNGGLYVYGSGTLALTQSGNGTSVGASKEYRLTLSGTSLKFERGDTLANITETVTRTLPSSIAGRTFYLGILTGNPDYCPGAFDWISVKTQ